MTRIQTLYSPGSFTPLLRIETATEELAKAVRRTLAEKLQQDGGGVFPPELVAMLDNLDRELNAGQISEHSQQWLAGCGLTPEQMKNQMEPVYTPQRKLHLYHCDHRGLPLVLIDADGGIARSADFDEWGNVLQEDNPDNLQQLIRLPWQQYDQETGLYYNRHRYYDPQQGRYITQDPIGLRGVWNYYQYPLNPIQYIDLLGLMLESINLPGLGDTYLDDDFYTHVQTFIDNASANGVDLHFNSAYRSPQHQNALHNDPNAITPADHSLHSCGFA